MRLIQKADHYKLAKQVLCYQLSDKMVCFTLVFRYRATRLVYVHEWKIGPVLGCAYFRELATSNLLITQGYDGREKY